MKIAGEATLQAPVEAVWEALLDPAVLVRTIPGCERLETVGRELLRDDRDRRRRRDPGHLRRHLRAHRPAAARRRSG